MKNVTFLAYEILAVDGKFEQSTGVVEMRMPTDG